MVFGRGGLPMRGIAPKPCNGGAPASVWEGVRRACRVDEISDLGRVSSRARLVSQSEDAGHLRPATTFLRWASRQCPRCASNAPIPRPAQTEHRVNLVRDVVGDDRVYRLGHLRHPLRQRLRRWRNDAMCAKFMSPPDWSLMGHVARGQPAGSSVRSDLLADM